MRWIACLAILAPFLTACSGGKEGDLSKKDDQELRNNFARALTPEELAHMGKSKPPPAKDKK